MAMDGIIRRIDDSFWSTHSAPNGYRCRCSMISLTEEQAHARSGYDSKGKALGVNKQATLPDGTPAKPDKGWEYNPKDRLDGVKAAIKSRDGKASPVLLSALDNYLQGIPAVTLKEIYARAQQVKPEFDGKITKIAEAVGGEALLPELKALDRAKEKINANYNGDASMIRDVLRASVIVSSGSEVTAVYQSLFDDFDVIETSARNGYAEKVHSSDGYFHAKMDVVFNGIFAEIQIHTQAMMAAKGMAHKLFEQRQTIKRSIPKGARPTQDQARRMNELNKQMRELFRKAAHNV